jgi:hypothetical protein
MTTGFKQQLLYYIKSIYNKGVNKNGGRGINIEIYNHLKMSRLEIEGVNMVKKML